ncbi:MAG: rod shape-determining protein MreD [Flavobacteriales bacterium]|nr:rod shape-determining protein MreD [Flavobacteriales bacterium]
MLIDIIKHSTRFLALLLLQGLVLNNIELSDYINPFLYVLFILSLPLYASKYLVLALSFVMGISIDIFSSTLGMHTAASVFMGFLRPYILKILEPRDGYENNFSVNIADMGMKWYAIYVVIMVFTHHLFLFYVESFSFSQFFSTFGRALVSTIFTLLLISITQLFYYKPSKKRR